MKNYTKICDIKTTYPYWDYNSKREYLKCVRKRWMKFRKQYKDNNIHFGRYYYPGKVYHWLSLFDEMDESMKKYYKNS